MAADTHPAKTLIVGATDAPSGVLKAPGPMVGALGPSGLWLALSGDTVWKPTALVDAVNGLLAKCPAKAVRVLATRALLVDAAIADRAGGAIDATPDQRHVATFLDRRQAPYQLFVDEQIDALGLVGAGMLQFCLPDYGTEMYLVEECAQAAQQAGRPDIACLAYAEAFRTNPYYAFQPLYREPFELVALQAGDTEVPGIGGPATKVFEDRADTTALRQPPKVSGGATLRIFLPAKLQEDKPDAYPPVAPTPGRRIDSDLLMFGALLVRFRHKDDLAPSPQVDFFTDMTAKRLQLDWERMRELDRLKTERAAFQRFGATLSASGAVKPFLPQAVLLMEMLRQGMPPRMAMEPLMQRIDELENA